MFSFTFLKKNARVVFFGDSITEAGVQPGGYISQMRDSLTARNLGGQFDLFGAGIGGNKVYDLYLRLESDVFAHKPKIVVIYVGVNDVWHKKLFGTGTDPDKFKKFYDALISKMQQKKMEVVLCTPACIGEKKDGGNQMDKDLDAFAQIIRDLAKEKNCTLCDFRKSFTDYEAAHNDTNLDSNILTTDGVHLNVKGNKMVAEMLLDRIETLGGK
jgi:lysophospholipase L1-like esterase